MAFIFRKHARNNFILEDIYNSSYFILCHCISIYISVLLHVIAIISTVSQRFWYIFQNFSNCKGWHRQIIANFSPKIMNHEALLFYSRIKTYSYLISVHFKMSHLISKIFLILLLISTQALDRTGEIIKTLFCIY